jgi:FkbM family methyltransferase
LGLEPNPSHAEKLQRLATSYAGSGIHVHFYPFAAWREDGKVGLNLTSRDDSHAAEAGAHLNMMGIGRTGKEVKVQTVDLASFILSLPEQSVELLIMDIQGSEYETMAWLLMQGVLCDKYVRRIMVRANDHGEITHWGQEGAFKHGTHPRSFAAMQEKFDLLRDYGWCKPDALPALMQLKVASD